MKTNRKIVVGICGAVALGCVMMAGANIFPEKVSADTVTIANEADYCVYGGAVRVSDETRGPGVKFHVVMTPDKFDTFGTINADGTGTLDDGVTTGTLLLPYKLTYGNELTVGGTGYGAAVSGVFVVMILWFGCYNQVLTSDKFTSLFGSLIPAISLLLVMVLRMVPNLMRKATQFAGARKSIGKGAGENTSAKEKLRDGMPVLSALVSWALEGGIVTGDSMRARGYGTAKRTSFMIYRMTALDWVLLCLLPLLLALVILAACQGQLAATYTPDFAIAPLSWGIVPYTLYLLIPTVLYTKEAIQWHIMRSRI